MHSLSLSTLLITSPLLGSKSMASRALGTCCVSLLACLSIQSAICLHRQEFFLLYFYSWAPSACCPSCSEQHPVTSLDSQSSHSALVGQWEGGEGFTGPHRGKTSGKSRTGRKAIRVEKRDKGFAPRDFYAPSAPAEPCRAGRSMPVGPPCVSGWVGVIGAELGALMSAGVGSGPA